MAIVVPPALTVTIAVPAARLLVTSNPALGKVLTDVSAVPVGRVSVMIAVPAGTISGVPQEPAGARPAATETGVAGVPATLNVKGVPAATPLQATLQI